MHSRVGALWWVLELRLVAGAVAAVTMGSLGRGDLAQALHSSWMPSLVRQSGSELFIHSTSVPLSACHVPKQCAISSHTGLKKTLFLSQGELLVYRGRQIQSLTIILQWDIQYIEIWTSFSTANSTDTDLRQGMISL